MTWWQEGLSAYLQVELTSRENWKQGLCTGREASHASLLLRPTLGSDLTGLCPAYVAALVGKAKNKGQKPALRLSCCTRALGSQDDGKSRTDFSFFLSPYIAANFLGKG